MGEEGGRTKIKRKQKKTEKEIFTVDYEKCATCLEKVIPGLESLIRKNEKRTVLLIEAVREIEHDRS